MKDKKKYPSLTWHWNITDKVLHIKRYAINLFVSEIKFSLCPSRSYCCFWTSTIITETIVMIFQHQLVAGYLHKDFTSPTSTVLYALCLLSFPTSCFTPALSTLPLPPHKYGSSFEDLLFPILQSCSSAQGPEHGEMCPNSHP